MADLECWEQNWSVGGLRSGQISVVEGPAGGRCVQ